jgi:hypothetical protein
MRGNTGVVKVATRFVVGAALALCVGAVPALAQGDRFTATANNMSGVGRQGVIGPVDIVLNRYSTEDERNRFLAVLNERGPEALLDVFQKAPSIGRLGAPGRIGYEIRYAAEMPGEDGGRRIVIATDRRMSFFEAANRPRTVDYPFTVVQLNLDNEGKGDGRASIYARIEVDKKHNTIVLEDIGIQPVTLMNVQASPKKK